VTGVSPPNWFKDNAPDFDGEIRFNEPLSRHGWYRIGGPAKIFCVPRSYEGLCWIREGLRETGSPFAFLGMGSNLLVSDHGFDGVIIRTTRMNLEANSFLSKESLELQIGASVLISSFLRRAAQEGWGGLEFLAGIPGSVGGAVVMNAGTHLGEAASKLIGVNYIRMDAAISEPDSITVEGDELRFDYRKNLFLPDETVVWSTRWAATPANPADVRKILDETLARRKATQPIDLPSCGSVFKNPKGGELSAWQVIDLLKLRGYRLGGAQFSEKHCNFIVNIDAARARDVRELIDLAKRRAQNELGIRLEEEVRYLGTFGD